jgi:hypothetical protein
MEITLSLPDEWVAKAGRLASRSGRGVEEVIREALSLSFGGSGGGQDLDLSDSVPWKDRSDDDILRLSELRLSDTEDSLLTNLLGKQREQTLNDEERASLAALMRRYEDGLLLKAEALREAVSRGLVPPLEQA